MKMKCEINSIEWFAVIHNVTTTVSDAVCEYWAERHTLFSSAQCGSHLVLQEIPISSMFSDI